MRFLKATPDQVLEEAKDWIKVHLIDSNMLITSLKNLQPKDDLYMIKTDKVEALYITRGDTLRLSVMDSQVTKELALRIKTKAVMGQKDTCLEFANFYTEKHGLTYKVKMNMGIHVLKKSNFKPLVASGRLVDLDIQLDNPIVSIVQKMMQDYDIDTGLTPYQVTLEQVHKGLLSGKYHVWGDTINGEFTPVSMAITKTHAFGDLYRINGVFTRREYRKRGYAGVITAIAAQWCFDQGCENVMLFTDLSNPVSNHVYEKIGFGLVDKAIDLEFE